MIFEKFHYWLSTGADLDFLERVSNFQKGRPHWFSEEKNRPKYTFLGFFENFHRKEFLKIVQKGEPLGRQWVVSLKWKKKHPPIRPLFVRVMARINQAFLTISSLGFEKSIMLMLFQCSLMRMLNQALAAVGSKLGRIGS